MPLLLLLRLVIGAAGSRAGPGGLAASTEAGVGGGACVAAGVLEGDLEAARLGVFRGEGPSVSLATRLLGVGGLLGEPTRKWNGFPMAPSVVWSATVWLCLPGDI